MKKLVFILMIAFSCLLYAQTSSVNQLNEAPYHFTVNDSTVSNEMAGHSVNKHSIGNFVLQMTLAPVVTFFMILPPMTASFGLSGNHGNRVIAVTGIVFMYSCYTFGISTGVHLFAKIENPANSLEKTFVYAAIGGGTGILLSFVLSRVDNSIWSFPLAAGPLIGALTYSLYLAKWPDKIDNNVFESAQRKTTPDGIKFYTHKDYIQNTMVFNCEVFRVNF